MDLVIATLCFGIMFITCAMALLWEGQDDD